MNKQMWVRLTNPETGGVHDVLDNPGVVESFEAKGWVREGTQTFQRPKGRPQRADGVRSRRELAHAENGVWPSAELQFAVRATNELVIELYCEGSKAKPHDREVIVTVGRKLDEPGVYLLDQGLDSPRWENVEGDDGFLYAPDRKGKVDAATVRCPQRGCSALHACDLTSERLDALADGLLALNGGKAARLQFEYRKLDTVLSQKSR